MDTIVNPYTTNARMMTVVAMGTERLLTALRKLDVQYIVVLPDGTTLSHGSLKLAPPEVPKPPRKPRRPFHKYYMPLIESQEVGSVVVIPWLEGETQDDLQGAIAAWCSAHWGNGTYVTHKAANGLELLRIA